MMRSSVPVMAIALALFAAQTSAAQPSGVQPPAAKDSAPPQPVLSWAVGGKLMSCRSWIANKPAAGQVETLSRIAPMNWLYGFMSGEAAASKQNILGDLHPSAIGDWLDNYCLAHPQDDIQKASTVLAGDLTGTASKRLPPMTEP